jgi:penicillin amidase
MPAPAAILMDALSITRASNAWVIGGTRTRSGKPILANDMHLSLRQPSIWYLMALHAPDLDVAGMTLPGVPNVIAGHTRAVAWGFTNAMMDDVDFFIERVAANDSLRYETPAGLQAFTTRHETVHVKGRREPVRFTVRSSRHGAIVSDVDGRLRGADVIAMQWAALDSSHSLHAFPRFNRARSAAELLAAIPLFDNPHQNVVYADTNGNFGYQMAGRIPVRGTRKRPPILPVPGWTGEWDWIGYVPFGEHPSARNPANGYAVTANNRQTRSAVGDLISNDWELPFRASRIREMVLESHKHDAADVHRMQLDVKDLLAVRYQTAAARAARAAGLAEVAQQLTAWNGVAAGESRAAAYFYAWYETLRRAAARTLFEADGHNLPRSSLNAALDSGALGWLGARGRPVLDSLSTAAMVTADSIARGKSWGDLHYVLIAHAMGEVAAVQKLLKLNVGPAPHYGSSTTVNVAHYDATSFPVRTSYGPSERHVVDMGNVDGVGGFILPSGQSGLPAGSHYADMFERWRRGGLWRIPLDRSAAEARTVHKIAIRPN